MRQVKLGEIYRAWGRDTGDGKHVDGIEDLLAVTDIPARFGVHLARLGNRLTTEIQAIEKQRINLVKQYGNEKMEKRGEEQVEVGTGNYTVTDQLEAYVAELDSMLDQEIEFMDKIQIPATKMVRGEVQDICIPIGCLMNLDPFIEIIE